jgi:hypothetical protein
MVKNIPHPWSEIDLARFGFLTMFLTAKSGSSGDIMLNY